MESVIKTIIFSIGLIFFALIKLAIKKDEKSKKLVIQMSLIGCFLIIYNALWKYLIG